MNRFRLHSPTPARAELPQARPRSLVTVLAAVVAAGVALLGPTSAASAATGTQRFQITYAGPFHPPDFPARTVIAVGAVQGKGTEQTTSQGPGPTPGTFSATTELAFSGGTLSLSVTGPSESHFNAHACALFVTITGSWVITGGTGVYEGATGEGTFTGRNVVFLERTPEGCGSVPNRLVSTISLVGSATVAGDQAA